ncbi:hypothetical protein MPSEU_000343600 [Mayamaea pseudoterrestris]|nr:hypothetical protein MPSEU_000343600 [Mayamaea pseudoterrestris]
MNKSDQSSSPKIPSAWSSHWNDAAAIPPIMHAHFDLFSGAAGDMMLAACLDASEIDLIDEITQRLELGLVDLAGEFSIHCKQVHRSRGMISAKHVTVESIYKHAAAPVPMSSTKHDSETSYHEASLHHDHGHAHAHGHNDEYTHSHVHSLEHSVSSGPMRNLSEIRRMLEHADEQFIPAWVKETAIETFTALAHAEASVHGAESIDHVHFHEVGAIDSIVDTVGTLLALWLLGAKTFSCSPLPLGAGMVKTQHGVLPVPAPATLALMKDMPVTRGPPDAKGELVTPTGAALIRTLVQRYAAPHTATGEVPQHMMLRSIGTGAGTKDFENHANILRLMLGELLPVSSSR